ncbi:terminase small subunit [Kiloniella sp. EL199]|uniref:terminase small subunit n=1 Tax=Kiloniella sp. EL199 TaxID=2107581 RepID=UPI000EA1B21A|nr:terminase small subunit [Kiloniella sp. EL199]
MSDPDLKQQLTERQKRFVEEYLIDFNATQAAIRAGYSPNSVKQSASRTLKNPLMQEAIEQAKAARSQRLQIDADYVLKGAVELFERCMQRSPAADADGEYKFQHTGAGKALEIIGRHVSVQAFKEKVEMSIENELIDRLMRGRKRLNDKSEN